MVTTHFSDRCVLHVSHLPSSVPFPSRTAQQQCHRPFPPSWDGNTKLSSVRRFEPGGRNCCAFELLGANVAANTHSAFTCFRRHQREH